MLLGKKQIHTSRKPNLKPRNKFTHRWTTNLQQKRHKKTTEKGNSLL